MSKSVELSWLKLVLSFSKYGLYSLYYPKGDSQDDPVDLGNRYTESNGKARNCVAGAETTISKQF